MTTYTFTNSDSARSATVQSVLQSVITALDGIATDANETQMTFENGAPIYGSAAATVQLSPGTGSFAFPGGSYDAGELPLSAVTRIRVLATDGQSNTQSFQFDDLPVTATGTALGAAATVAALGALIFSGEDDVTLGNRNDVLAVLGGDDDVVDLGGNNTLNGGGGDDTLTAVGTGRDRLVGGTGADEIYAGAGADRLEGGAGADTLEGEDGRDTLLGGAAADRLQGGAQGDVLTGGAGADRFLFGRTPDGVADAGLGAARRDVITDFQRGLDKLVFEPNLFATPPTYDFIGTEAFSGARQIRWVQGENGVILRINDTGSLAADWEIELRGLTRIAASDFDLSL